LSNLKHIIILFILYREFHQTHIEDVSEGLHLCGYEVLQVLTGHDLHGSHDVCEKVLRIKGGVKEWSRGRGNTGSGFFSIYRLLKQKWIIFLNH